MKKLLCVLLAMLMMVAVFAGCGSTTTTQEGEGTTVAQNDDYTPDSTLRILMVGNSFCYYYVEELYELLMENPPEGIDAVEIYNLYYSGCSLSMHYTWWMKNESNYDLFKTDATGRQNLNNIYKKWSLEQALAFADWDYISLQGSVVNGSYMNKEKREFTRNSIAETAEPLLARFHELHPNAQLLWHRTWYSEIGRVGSDGYVYTAEGGPKYDEGMQDICDWMCNEFDKDKPYDLQIVNSGAAWTEARKLNETLNLLPYGGLCARLNYNKFGDQRANSGDGYHDGDIGGAQLLNAYIWYMTLTGNTDLTASKYMPVYKIDALEYPLSKELVDMLKTAAMTSFNKK
ncbi:MAG: DUF4886 domain-containing protein [Oscillospiraceae bacterium]|nr:DUF4886 domain-containing protein [Oscillospiraceae bacterium]